MEAELEAFFITIHGHTRPSTSCTTSTRGNTVVNCLITAINTDNSGRLELAIAALDGDEVIEPSRSDLCMPTNMQDYLAF